MQTGSKWTTQLGLYMKEAYIKKDESIFRDWETWFSGFEFDVTVSPKGYFVRVSYDPFGESKKKRFII